MFFLRQCSSGSLPRGRAVEVLECQTSAWQTRVWARETFYSAGSASAVPAHTPRHSHQRHSYNNKKFELMLTRREKAYSSSGLVV